MLGHSAGDDVVIGPLCCLVGLIVKSLFLFRFIAYLICCILNGTLFS